jgi:acyl-CoA-dependent ceramide synthase
LRPEDGIWLAPWMQWQIFAPLAILQGLNLFWYTLMVKILWRGIVAKEVDDQRSDDEDDGEDDNDTTNEKKD